MSECAAPELEVHLPRVARV